MITDSLRSNWAVMISGTGSNLNALLDIPTLNINLVVSNKETAYGLSRARRRGIPVYHFENNNWEGLQNTLKQYLIDYIFLAGFMKICPESFLKDWQGKIFNIHPSLLPAYPGLNSIEKAFTNRAQVGVTIHEVIPAVDAGPVLLQKKSLLTETIESTEFYVHINEHTSLRKAFTCHKR